MDWEKTRKRRKMQFFKFSRIGWKKIKGREHVARLCIDFKKNPQEEINIPQPDIQGTFSKRNFFQKSPENTTRIFPTITESQDI